MVSYMDGAVGDIVALLRRKDEMFAKTLLVFQSDNGPHLPPTATTNCGCRREWGGFVQCKLLHTLCCACSLTHR